MRPVYHVEKPRPFISPLTLYGHVAGFFTGNLWNFSKSPVHFHEKSSNMTM